MNGQGFLEQKPRSPTSLGIVVLLHVAVISALALSKMDAPPQIDWGPLKIKDIPLTPEPDPVPPPPRQKPKVEPQSPSVITRTDPIVRTPLDNPILYPADEVVPGPTTDARPGPKVVEPYVPPQPDPVPMPDPVRIEAQLLSSSELLPPYPAVEERAQREGQVTVRLLIGPDGRVREIVKVAAASEAFWRATERHALRAWRFKPATLDGRPVESRKTMTVKFELKD